MKKFILNLSLPLILVSGTKTTFAEAVKLSVLAFEDESANNGSPCDDRHYWFPSLGNAMREMLVTELKKHRSFQILERKHIKKIYSDEHELVNSQKSKKPKAGQFKVADYTIAGAVSEFNLCSKGTGGGLDVGRMVGFGSLDIGAKQVQAEVAVDVRIIDVETGEIIDSVRTQATQKTTDFDLDVFNDRVDFDIATFKKTPLEGAVREAIQEAAKKLVKVIPETKS